MTTGKFLGKCLRCTVTRWDDTRVWALSGDGEVTLNLREGGGASLDYLRPVLHKGMQLNLMDEGRLVVLEPDFLVDISAVARLFTGYGHHPLLYTLERLKPRANTQAILLGNYAGTALDDIIHTGRFRLSDTLRRFFREQALQFTACADFRPARFKEEAARQGQNLVEAVRELHALLSGSPAQGDGDREGTGLGQALLEPSFVCEQLGLQGRVDLMTTDLRLLVEQKAGRNMNLERSAYNPQRTDHYVQLLLYYGVLCCNFPDRNVDATRLRLLYSHYPARQGLLDVSYDQTLFREAIRLRNQVVAVEYLTGTRGFGTFMPHLRAETVYAGVRRDDFFCRYVEPQVRDVSTALAALLPLERAYLERMMTFVYREQWVQKVGHHDGPDMAAADLWRMTPAEKQETGNIYTGLTVVDKQRSDEEGGGYDLITLDIPETEAAAGGSNFRRGDMVYLYAYDGLPDVRHAILYKGTLEEVGASQLVVRLHDGQQNPHVLEGSCWAVEHGGSDLTTTSSIKSLFQFVTTAPAARRQLLLGQRVPRRDTSLTLSRTYHPHYDDVLLRQRQSRDYFLLVGPPGTGKTSMALRFMVDEELHHGGTLLLTAYTNRAVDEICAMLTEAGHDYLRLGNVTSCDPRFRSHLLDTALAEGGTLADVRQRLRQVPVLVATSSMLLARPYLFDTIHFSLCIVDEASQILEPGLVGIVGNGAVDRFVLIGDYKQLPAVVQQSEDDARVTDPLLLDIMLTDCRQSLFERLIRWERHCGRTDFVGLLRYQGRMHPDIARFSDTHFYVREGLLPVPLPHQQEETLPYRLPADADELDRLLQQHRVAFFEARPAADTPDGAFVADLLQRIRRFYGQQFDAVRTVGVIVTYRSQIAPIRQQLEQLGQGELLDVSIDTVERYQGSQRDVIIYDFGVENATQLAFLTQNTFVEDGRPIDRKLNVALTRARRQLLLVGRATVLRQNPLLRELLDICQTGEEG